MVPITSPIPRTLGQNLTGSLALLSLLVTVSPVGKRETSSKWAFCVFPCAESAGWARVHWVGSSRCICPQPQLPVVSRWEQFSPLFQFQIGFKFPNPVLMPPKPVFFPKKDQTWLGLAFPLLLQLKTKSNFQGK